MKNGFVWGIFKKIAHVESMTFYYGWNVGEYQVFSYDLKLNKHGIQSVKWN